MVSLGRNELVLGAAAFIALIIAGTELAGYSSDLVLPRESVCIMPASGGDWLSGYPEALMARAGSDPVPGRLVMFRAGIGPDGVPLSIDLGISGTRNGSGRLYQLAYRKTPDACGWLDGLSYPERPGMTPDPLPIDADRALSAIGKVRFDSLGLSGLSLVLETVPAPGNPPVPSVVLFENGTPVDPAPADSGLMPFSLLVSEKSCRSVTGRDPSCSLTPRVSISFVGTGEREIG
ncbi:hypothetical protein [Methanoregula sp.]|uniref:hypothetical protein n=1 Tax=Methanoregula sp. TaxID=2052170 RepID=UPI002C1A3133|nr:hypothetical protein [Methanoregula sp.]HVP97586.1 hypothetical protein [Methanoregula sp.]